MASRTQATTHSTTPTMMVESLADWRDVALQKVESVFAEQYAIMTGNIVTGTIADLLAMLAEFFMSLLGGCLSADSADELRSETGRPLKRARQARLRINIRDLRRDEPLARQLSVEQIEMLGINTARAMNPTDLSQFVRLSRAA